MKKHIKYVYAILAATIVATIFRYFEYDFMAGWLGCLAYVKILKYYSDNKLLKCIEEVELYHKSIKTNK